jgi:peptide-methionine (S)-S-oxide reductase
MPVLAPLKSALLSTLCLAVLTVSASAAEKKPMPEKSSSSATERLTFGGGCFWCIEAVFQRLDGVKKVVSGYAGGHVANPTYEAVCAMTTGHAEVVQIEFDPAKLPLANLLEIFWAAHDPTSVLKQDTYAHGKMLPKGTAIQGADAGPQYRSIILYENDAQKSAAEKSKTEAQKDFPDPIATEIVPLKAFYAAEDSHQNYYNLNQNRNPYCSAVITPKLQKLIQKGQIKAD